MINDDSYNLEERLARFAESVIDLMKKIPQDAVNIRMIPQEVAAAGSSGANYSEANEAESKKDSAHKASSIVKKELKESKHWLRLLARANPAHKEEFRKLWQENHELLLIFSKIIKSCRRQ
jgi:four helix bundle protein